MRRTITTLLFLVAVALLIAAVSLPMVPQWLTVPGGLLALLAAAFVGITQLGEGLRAWRDLLFGNKKPKEGPAPDQLASGHNARNIKADTYVENLNLEQTFPEPGPGENRPDINLEAGKDLNLGTFVGGDQNITNTTTQNIFSPAPDKPPTGSAPPLRQTKFVERDSAIMDGLRRALRAGGTSVIVSGMGGVGKTELAVFLREELEREFPNTTLFVFVGDRTTSIVQQALADTAVVLDDVRLNPGFDVRLCLPPPSVADFGNFAIALLNLGHKAKAKHYALQAKAVFERVGEPTIIRQVDA